MRHVSNKKTINQPVPFCFVRMSCLLYPFGEMVSPLVVVYRNVDPVIAIGVPAHNSSENVKLIGNFCTVSDFLWDNRARVCIYDANKTPLITSSQCEEQRNHSIGGALMNAKEGLKIMALLGIPFIKRKPLVSFYLLGKFKVLEGQIYSYRILILSPGQLKVTRKVAAGLFRSHCDNIFV